MKLEKKKHLAAKTLGVGKNRIVFNVERLAEIKEAITKQDIRDLFLSKAIFIKEKKGRKSKQKRRTRRRAGSIRKKIKRRKREYIILTRKLRSYLAELRKKENIQEKKYFELRKEIKAGFFKDKHHLKERLKKNDKNS
ncbi:MAG: 50S ribosomal protein L19e [Nanoarchaeota archaeon]